MARNTGDGLPLGRCARMEWEVAKKSVNFPRYVPSNFMTSVCDDGEGAPPAVATAGAKSEPSPRDIVCPYSSSNLRECSVLGSRCSFRMDRKTGRTINHYHCPMDGCEQSFDRLQLAVSHVEKKHLKSTCCKCKFRVLGVCGVESRGPGLELPRRFYVIFLLVAFVPRLPSLR
jgi:hypothetical protein